ncbi:hypothetical protein FB451DRAFT_791511 [Mycena latifolia]|nr:hypothetical protein FB451DRAFT_791511 [Mycena latifolia]
MPGREAPRRALVHFIFSTPPFSTISTMRFISSIYVSVALLWAAQASPVPTPTADASSNAAKNDPIIRAAEPAPTAIGPDVLNRLISHSRRLISRLERHKPKLLLTP